MATAWGALVASSPKERVDCSGPIVVGAKPTCTVQVAPSASAAPAHVFAVMLNDGSPVSVAVVMLTVVFPSFVSVTVCGLAVFPGRRPPNATELGLAVALDCRSLPVRLIDCGEAAASSAIASEAGYEPRAGGVKVTLTEQPIVVGSCWLEHVSALRE